MTPPCTGVVLMQLAGAGGFVGRERMFGPAFALIMNVKLATEAYGP